MPLFNVKVTRRYVAYHEATIRVAAADKRTAHAMVEAGLEAGGIDPQDSYIDLGQVNGYSDADSWEAEDDMDVKLVDATRPWADGEGRCMVCYGHHDHTPPCEGADGVDIGGANEPPRGFATDDTHGMYTRAAWTDAVGAGDTRGYWEWVKMKIEDTRQIAEQFGVVEPHTDPEDQTRIHTGEFSRAIMAGYTVTPHVGPLIEDGPDVTHYETCGPDGAELIEGTCYLTERAAWGAAEAHRLASEPKPGEFTKVIMLGYRVNEDGPGEWSVVGPDDEDITPAPFPLEPGAQPTHFPTERAAYEAADNHRMFGTITAPGAGA